MKEYGSYEKIDYSLRPSKQVERKIFIDTLRILQRAGYKINDYTYVGLGSIFFFDFILFHKFLHIKKMICAEIDPIHERMKFNKPYNFIKYRPFAVSTVLAELESEAKYIVWLDYDSRLSPSMLDDIDGFIKFLAPGSIFIVTIEAVAKLEDEEKSNRLSLDKRESLLVEEYDHYYSNYLTYTIEKRNFSKNELPLLIYDIVLGQIEASLANKKKKYHQLFNYKYSDGTQMLSIGGLIDDSSCIEKLEKSKILRQDYITTKREQIKISVPPLTLRERLYLDKKVHKPPSKRKINLEIREELLSNYYLYYKYYPSYHEIIA